MEAYKKMGANVLTLNTSLPPAHTAKELEEAISKALLGKDV